MKIQSAYFEQYGSDGILALAEVIKYAKKMGWLIILDVKRSDIGSTATAYANAYLNDTSDSNLVCDAVTLNPLMGKDSLDPFLNRLNHKIKAYLSW